MFQEPNKTSLAFTVRIMKNYLKKRQFACFSKYHFNLYNIIYTKYQCIFSFLCTKKLQDPPLYYVYSNFYLDVYEFEVYDRFSRP